jgi:predicted ATPase
MSYKVFVSHSSKDKPVADAVCRALEDEGFHCWIAPRDILPGQDWSEAIIEGLSECSVIVLIFSESSNNSVQVKREVQRAFEKGKSVVPLRIDDVVPSGAMEYYLSSVHWLTALEPPLERHLSQLTDAVQRLLPKREVPIKLPVDEAMPVQALATLPSVSPTTPSSEEAHSSPVCKLPIQTTPLVGRAKEVAEVKERLSDPDVRLLTLTGPGGTGKSRLAVQAASELLEAFLDGVYFVNLAPVEDSHRVVWTIAQTLDVREAAGQSYLESLKTYLQSKRLLLVLDNFEQVLDAAPLLSNLLAAAPHVKMIVTSRAVLRITGEHEIAVHPLSLPNPRRLPPVENLLEYEAVALFVNRAKAVKPDFALNAENAASVVEICERLDGLPLAIELAAARVRMLAPQFLLTRLENRMKLLTGGGKDLPERQQTLRGAMEWSHDLLEEGERVLFRRLSVFVGGCSLDSVEAVCDAEGDLEIDFFDGLDSTGGKDARRAEPRPQRGERKRQPEFGD